MPEFPEKPVRLVKGGAYTLDRQQSRLVTLARLREELKQMLSAVEKLHHAAQVGNPDPVFPPGRDPFNLVPRITQHSFACFYKENQDVR